MEKLIGISFTITFPISSRFDRFHEVKTLYHHVFFSEDDILVIPNIPLFSGAARMADMGAFTKMGFQVFASRYCRPRQKSTASENFSDRHPVSTLR